MHGHEHPAGSAGTTGTTTAPRTDRPLRRLATGAGHGVIATIAMSAVMLLGMTTGLAPMPEPIPRALVAHTLGDLPPPALLALTVLAHLGYGALAGTVLAAVVRRPSLWLGAGYGALLWLVMGVVWLPVLGWGLFGTTIAPAIAVATLVLHLVYGLTLAAAARGSGPGRPTGPRRRRG